MSLPSGVVTFVFSDIEGSTRLWESDPDGMRTSLRRHDEIVRETVEASGGYVFKHTGDGFGAAFESVSSGLQAAARVAVALADEPWDGPSLMCRFGVHSGESQPRDGDYFGPTVTRTARLMDAGNGGQIIVSQAAHQLVGDRPPAGMSFVDAGEHRLKDLGEPIGLYRLVGSGATDDRELRTLESAPHNLPLQLSSFVGREANIKEVADLVRDSRLVTLTGIGGVGKTRLSLQVAAEVLSDFDDGAWFVELASLAEAGLLADAIGAALHVAQDPTVTALERVLHHLATRRSLIVIDNCEHLIDDVAQMVDTLLRACPDVHVLATSREGLAVTGEVLWRVPSLRVDDDSAAIELFAERARLVRPDFAVTDDNRDAVADLCIRLDGIPLAIELATARLKMLSVEQVAEHLGDRFRLLTGGSRTAVERQRTLRAMMDWSYDLLSDTEQALLRRLAVFYDGFTYQAAEDVCSGETLARFEVLDLLGKLVEASLVVFEDNGEMTRYRLLETVRQYSLDKLFEAGEADEARLRHAEWVREFALAHDEAINDDRSLALRYGDLELGNIRAALTWSIEVQEGVMAVEIAVGIRQYLWLHVMYDEAVRWLTAALALVEDDATPLVGRALANALTDAGNTDNFDLVDQIQPRATRMYELTSDPEARGELANALATVLIYDDPQGADDLQKVAHTSLREAGSSRWVYPLQNRIITAFITRDPSDAEEVEALTDEAVAEGLGGSIHSDVIHLTYALLREEYDHVLARTDVTPIDDWEAFMVLSLRTAALRAHGRLDEARQAIDRAATIGKWGKNFTGWASAMLAIEQGDPDAAVAAFAPVFDNLNPRNIVGCVDAARLGGLVASLGGQFEQAALLLGFGHALAERVGRGLPAVDRKLLDKALADSRDALGDDFDTVVERGAAMAWEDLPLDLLETPFVSTS